MSPEHTHNQSYVNVTKVGTKLEQHFKGQSEAVQLVADGLTTDGAHHKQWYLYQIALKLGFTESELSEINKGVAP